MNFRFSFLAKLLKPDRDCDDQAVTDVSRRDQAKTYPKKICKSVHNFLTDFLGPIYFKCSNFPPLKRFNNTFGHDTGDAMLLEFNNIFQRMSRKEDIACRFGGEEFVLVLPGAIGPL